MNNILQRSAETNPMEVIENVVDFKDWWCERQNMWEMSIEAPGRWCDYSMFFSWAEDYDALHFTCAFDMRVEQAKRPAVYELLSFINEKLWMGHFGIWSDEGIPVFRHAMLLRGQKSVTAEQIDDLMTFAVEESDRFYPAFQHVVWGGKHAREAVAAALIDTVGEA